ncbi:MAG TPA: PIN domain-containing protein [Ktedonobacterales bacterium]|nr:PIN domain-containing protein [Ktedonobacterales bacterium]
MYDAFLLRMRRSLVRPNAETGQIYGAIRAELTAKGQPIQHNDIWIAALARQFGLTLATRDHDFERVSGCLSSSGKRRHTRLSSETVRAATRRIALAYRML